MLLTNIDHVAIAVRDLDAAIAYYAEAFGAEVHHREIVESDGVEEALVKVADSYIQLTAATRPDSLTASQLPPACPSRPPRICGASSQRSMARAGRA